jgi:hypothetical protein
MLAQAFLTVLRAQSTAQAGKKLMHHSPLHPSSLLEFKRQRGLTCP